MKAMPRPVISHLDGKIRAHPGPEPIESVLHHVNKSVDYVAIDLKGASKAQIKAIQGYVSGLTKEQQEKIIYVRE
jgi:hypothetical protein